MTRSTRPTLALTGDQVSELLCADPADVDDRGLTVEVAMLHQLIQRAETALTARVAVADQRQVYAADGHRTTRSWVQAVTGCPAGEATARVQVAALIRDQADYAPAFRLIGVASVRELARLNANPRCRGQLADAMGLLIGHATKLPYPDFVKVCKRWEQNADADGAHRSADRAHDARHLHLAQVDHEFHIRGIGGAAQGATISAILQRFIDAEFAADWEACRERHGHDATAEMCERSPAQRRFDALHAVFLAAAKVGVTSADQSPGRGFSPHVNIIVDQDTFEAALMAAARGTSFEQQVAAVGGFGWVGRRCETADGAPIDPLDAVAAAMIGYVRRVVLTSKGVPINVGRKQRLFRGVARFAALFDHRRCIWPGCTQHARQVDHSTPWAQAGTTDQDNATPLCGWHNRWRTRGYVPVRDDDGTWFIARPDGSFFDHRMYGFSTIQPGGGDDGGGVVAS